MTDMQTGQSDPEKTEERVEIISSAIVEAFGAEACVFIETQIEFAEGDNNAIWIAIWEKVCSSRGRRAV